jgi:hypothetical protein
LALAAFIVLAAFLSVLADLEWPAVVGVTALAWAIAAMVEWLAWQPGMAWPGQRRYRAIPTPPGTEPPVQPSAPPEPRTVVYAEPFAEEPTPEPVHEPEPSPPVEELVVEEPAAPPEPEPVGAGLVPPADPEPPTPAVDREPRERRSWLPPMRRRPSGTDSERPPEEPEPETVEEPQQPQLRAVEAPSPAPEPAAPAPAPPDSEEASVVRMSSRRAPEPQQWNLWDLESIARQEARSHPARRDEWSYLFVHLRQFADAQGTLPSEFDALVRESFGEMLEARNLV